MVRPSESEDVLTDHPTTSFPVAPTTGTRALTLTVGDAPQPWFGFKVIVTADPPATATASGSV
jgi:hypothetical protein